MNKPKLTSILRISLSLFLLALLLWLSKKNFAKIWQLLRQVNISKFSLAFLLYIISNIFIAWRLKIVLSAQKIFLNIKELFSLTFIGYFFTNLMPTSVGGDLVKAYFIAKENKSKVASYTSVFVDRILGLFSLVFIAGIALLVTRRDIQHSFIFWTVGLLFLLCIIFILFVNNRNLFKRFGDYLGILRLLRFLKVDAQIKKAYDSISAYKNQKKRLFQALIVSLVAQFILFSAVFILSSSLSVYIPFGKVLLLMPIIFVICMLPVTMNGLGLREWSFVLFFSPYAGEAAALSFSLLFLAMFLLSSLIGGINYLFRR